MAAKVTVIFAEKVEKCVRSINKANEHIKPIFPCPGGGLSMNNIQELKGFFGINVMYLMGGGLFRCGNDLTAACKEF